ncbi:acyl-CoA thioesterase [Chenggangzhangella methanolivorans]|uniref:Thioesterase family protein n=1 Tax=Chenggangzhangella methanolivorans TaxID=1437009 RepID=A0A9E6R9L2_9HYPH|nr:thioesterase family protein [Chenggangzhangella methanolivorans]QZO00728.1 thioesterase family protein [Chenggangzhangella methanolivorans]
MNDAPYLSPPLEIESRFLDHNGHVNMAYHLVLADTALDLAFGELKGPDYVEARGMTTFAAEMHVRYLREMKMGEEIRGRVRFVAADAKRAHWAVELVRGSDGETVTTAEGVTMSVSVASRKVAPFPEDVFERLTARVARDAPGAAGLDWLGRRVAMRK